MGTADNRSNGGFWGRVSTSMLARVALVYPVVAWVVIQVADAILPALKLPEWTITLVVVLAVLGYPLALVLAWASNRKIPVAVPADIDPESIAVLPFADMSPESDQAYFCEGMAEEIINDLVKVAKLKVVSRTSSFSFQKSDQDARQIGTELRVANILEGSVRKSGNRLRVTAQLINVCNGYHLWSERYDRNFEDVFAIQDEISYSIVNALHIKLSPDEKMAIQLPMACTAEAYDSYLKGRHHFYRFSRMGLEVARQMFELAIQQCDTYAPAYAGLADTMSFMYTYSEARPEFLDAALEYSAKAVEIGPDLALTHASRGLAAATARHAEEAERHFQKALQLDAGLFEAHYFYARFLQEQQRHEDAISHMEKAAALNPQDYQSRIFLSSMVDATDKDKRLHWAREGKRVALEHLSREPDDVRAMYLLSGALVHLGEKQQAIEFAERAITMQPTVDTYYNVACTYALLKNKDKALDLLESANMKGRNYAWVAADSDLSILHGDPRFDAILASLRED